MAALRFSGYHTGSVVAARYQPSIGCIISIGEDKMLMCSLWRKDSNSFWPSVAQPLPGIPTALEYDESSRRAFVGLDSGSILDFAFTEDYNTVQTNRTIPAHGGRVTSIVFDRERELLLSAARDKSFALHNVLNGALVARHKVDAWMSLIQYDAATQNIFVGDYRGNIHALRIADGLLKAVNVLTGHTGCIRSLVWVPAAGFLFSGSADKTVVAWDIGGHKGVMYELCRHTSAVHSLVYLADRRELVSVEETLIVVWSMAADRGEAPDWEESDTCQLCQQPFMWNLSEMWQRRKFAINRQHHCRACGKAVCDACSPSTATLPRIGLELPVRMCRECVPTITPEMKTPLCRTSPVTKVTQVLPVPASDLVLTILADNSVNVLKLDEFLGGVTAARVDDSARRSAPAPAAAAAAGAAAPAATAAPHIAAYSVSGPAENKASLLDSLDD